VIAQHAIMLYDDTKLLSHENKIGQKWHKSYSLFWNNAKQNSPWNYDTQKLKWTLLKLPQKKVWILFSMTKIIARK
jgi:hypothetical protein